VARDKPLSSGFVGAGRVDLLPPNNGRGMSLSRQGRRPSPVAFGPLVREMLRSPRSRARESAKPRPVYWPGCDLVAGSCGRGHQAEHQPPQQTASIQQKCHQPQSIMVRTKIGRSPLFNESSFPSAILGKCQFQAWPRTTLASGGPSLRSGLAIEHGQAMLPGRAV